MINKYRVVTSLVFLFGAGFVSSGQAHPVRAKVTYTEPVYQTVIVEEPVTTCSREYVERRVRSGSVAGQTLAGAVIGAAIGRQFGDGSGRDALTVIGAVAGSAVANDRAVRRHGNAVTVIREPVQRCTTTMRRRTERRITGYWVEYRDRGRTYRVLSRERPGRTILVARRS